MEKYQNKLKRSWNNLILQIKKKIGVQNRVKKVDLLKYWFISLNWKMILDLNKILSIYLESLQHYAIIRKLLERHETIWFNFLITEVQ